MSQAEKILNLAAPLSGRVVMAKTHESFRPLAAARWRFAEVRGRIVEISSLHGGAVLTMACALLHSAQAEGEPVAWIARAQSVFYPPDAARFGVDLDALVVVRSPDAIGACRAADKLARSGAFGLVVIDRGGDEVWTPILSRLSGLALQHDCAVVFLTSKDADAPSLGSLVSLRAEARYAARPDGRFLCRLRALKDKRRGPGWEDELVCEGPPGLC